MYIVYATEPGNSGIVETNANAKNTSEQMVGNQNQSKNMADRPETNDRNEGNNNVFLSPNQGGLLSI